MEYPKALKRVKSVENAAERGNRVSMYKLGSHYCYLTFCGQTKNVYETYLQGLYWLSKSAHMGVWKAYFLLGRMVAGIYHFTSGGPYFARAMDEYRKDNYVFQSIIKKLEEDGFTSDEPIEIFEANTAWIFLNCTVVFSDHRLCKYYYNIAAEHGHIDAKEALEEIEKRLQN